MTTLISGLDTLSMLAFLVVETLTIIVPCHNESEAIPLVVPKLLATKKSLLEKSLFSRVEIKVVDDASIDTSMTLLNSFSAIDTICNFQRMGYGASIKKGIANSSTDHVAFLDMDNTYSPEDLIIMAEKITQQRSFVVGVRNRGDGMPWTRRFGNTFYQQTIRFCFGQRLADPCSGMWICRRKDLLDVFSALPNELHFSLKLSLLMLKESKSYLEVPVSYGARTGRSKLGIVTDGFTFLFSILKFRVARWRN